MAPTRRNGGFDESSAARSRPPRVSVAFKTRGEALRSHPEALAREAALLGRGETPLLQRNDCTQSRRVRAKASKTRVKAVKSSCSRIAARLRIEER